MKYRLLLAVVLVVIVLALLSGCKTMPKAPVLAEHPVSVFDTTKEYRPLQLGRIVSRIPRGKTVGGIYEDFTCFQTAKWKHKVSGMVEIGVNVYEDVFREDMAAAGFDVAGDPGNLFEDKSLSDNGAEYIVGALIKDFENHVCIPLPSMNPDSIKGWCRMKVEWQFFSSLQQQVVYKITTEGLYNQEDSSDDVDNLDLARNAFSSALHGLMADKGFLDLVSTDSKEREEEKTMFETPIVLDTPPLSKTRLSEHIAQARDAAVLIHIGSSGHGSGFFITRSGYLLTNRHVTGIAKRITVEMSTGRKLVAEVIRTDPRRDIALLKVEDGLYPALPIQLNEPEISTEVYAIGAPLRKKLKFTVTKGIVSAYRLSEGVRYLQSDVNTQSGNSGGPMLDPLGNVVAVCVVSFLNYSGENFGANGFIPIKSGLDALNIRIK